MRGSWIRMTTRRRPRESHRRGRLGLGDSTAAPRARPGAPRRLLVYLLRLLRGLCPHLLLHGHDLLADFVLRLLFVLDDHVDLFDLSFDEIETLRDVLLGVVEILLHEHGTDQLVHRRAVAQQVELLLDELVLVRLLQELPARRIQLLDLSLKRLILLHFLFHLGRWLALRHSRLGSIVLRGWPRLEDPGPNRPSIFGTIAKRSPAAPS